MENFEELWAKIISFVYDALATITQLFGGFFG